MNTVYDRNYQKLALDIAHEAGYSSFIRNGCYCMLSGPSFETVAEMRLASLVSFLFKVFFLATKGSLNGFNERGNLIACCWKML